MDYLNTYTSTGSKLVYHPEVLVKLKRGKKATPISLQIAPTSQCNLSCVFCSNVNRKKHESLDQSRLTTFIKEIFILGLKTVEWTGGGDPTLYEHINFMINMCHLLGLEQGLITNGIALKEKIERDNLDYLKWVRVSMNCLDYVDKVDLPKIEGVLGFSYVINAKTNNTVWSKLGDHVEKYKPFYVRIVPNCQTTIEQQIENNKYWSELVEDWGPPYFYQAKTFSNPERCWWGYFKPFLLHDGWVYPCSSVVLNEDSERSFHQKYRWYKMQDVLKHYQSELGPFPATNCDRCVFRQQNDLVDSLLNSTEMSNFI